MDGLIKGDRVIITLANGISYEGNVKNLNKATMRLLLENVTEFPGNIEIDGFRLFMTDEIVEIKCIGNNVGEEKDLNLNAQTEDINVNFTWAKLSNEEHQRILELQNSYRYISGISNNFYDAMNVLEKSEVIGIHIEDASNGRRKRASVVAVSTTSEIILFDLETAGDKIFDNGLRSILQSPCIKKIVYDCRLMSDCLYHKHLTYLANVRDVEAEDIINVYQERGNIRKHSRPFHYLVRLYTGITSEELNANSAMTMCWEERPLNIKLQKYLAIYVSFLIPLHEAMQEHYLQRLINASKIYNEYIRDSDMFTFVTEDTKYVLQNELKNLVKRTGKCRSMKC